MDKAQILDVVVATIQANRANVVALIRKNGIALSPSSSDQDIYNAFVSLMKTSASFRNDFAKIIKATEAKATSKSLSANGTNFGRELTNTPASSVDTPRGGSSNVWDYLGRVFTPEVTSNLVNNIFGLFGSGNTTSQDMTMADSRFRERENFNEGKGMGTGTIIAISLGAIALLGLTIYFVRKK